MKFKISSGKDGAISDQFANANKDLFSLNRSEFVELKNSEKGPIVNFTNPEYLKNCVESDDILVDIVRSNSKMSLNFAAGLVAHLDDWIGSFYSFNRQMREYMSTKEFNELSKPYARRLVEKLLESEEEFNLPIYDESPEFAPLYNSLSKFETDTQYNLVNKIFNLKKSDAVLEIGSGTGNLSLRLAKEVKSVVGIDTFVTFSEFSKNEAKNKNVNNVEFLNGYYPQHSPLMEFDYVIGFSVSPKVLLKDKNKLPKKALFARFGDSIERYNKTFDERKAELLKFYNITRNVEKLPHWDKNTILDYMVLTRI